MINSAFEASLTQLYSSDSLLIQKSSSEQSEAVDD